MTLVSAPSLSRRSTGVRLEDGGTPFVIGNLVPIPYQVIVLASGRMRVIRKEIKGRGT